MPPVTFKKATRYQLLLRMGLCGPAGSGKTLTALRVMRGLVGPTGRIAVIDTEHESASLYADEFEFDTCTLQSYSPQHYREAIRAAVEAGYDGLVIDTLSHAWMGKGGVLEMVDAKKGSGNQFTAWKDVTPEHNKLVEAILGAQLHVIATMRSKMEYVLQQDDKGKQVPRKVGMAPVQRDGMEYEFGIVGEMDQDNGLTITKSRCRAIPTGTYIHHPGEELAETIRAWLPGAEREPSQDELLQQRLLAYVKEQLPLVPDGTTVKAQGRTVDLKAHLRENEATLRSDPGALKAAVAQIGHATGKPFAVAV